MTSWTTSVGSSLTFEQGRRASSNWHPAFLWCWVPRMPPATVWEVCSFCRQRNQLSSHRCAILSFGARLFLQPSVIWNSLPASPITTSSPPLSVHKKLLSARFTTTPPLFVGTGRALLPLRDQLRICCDFKRSTAGSAVAAPCMASFPGTGTRCLTTRRACNFHLTPNSSHTSTSDARSHHLGNCATCRPGCFPR